METSSSSEDEDSEEEAGEEGMNRQNTVNKRGLSLAAQLRQVSQRIPKSETKLFV